ncbi:MAG: hypothetical protein WA126_13205 [Thermodesulfovibrionales bacterium]
MARKIMMLIDTSRCIGCKACQVACKQWHSLPAEATSFNGSYTNPPALSKSTLTFVKFSETLVNSKLRFLFFKKQCLHCNQARCLIRCPKGGDKMSGGLVVFNNNCKPANIILKAKEKKALKNGTWGPGTGKLYPNWPSGVPAPSTYPFGEFMTPPVTFLGPELAFLKEVMSNPLTGCLHGVPALDPAIDGSFKKCDFCADRFEGGNYTTYRDGYPTTACELTCPSNAILTDDAGAIMTEARKRLSTVKRQYRMAGLWGGRGRVIYLLTESASNYGLSKI